MKKIKKILTIIGILFLTLIPFITLKNDVVVNAQIDSNVSYPITDGVIDYNYFDNYLDGTFGYNFTYGERIYMQPKFNLLNSTLVDSISSTFTLGYFYHINVSHLNGVLTFNIPNNTISLVRGNISNIYFNNGAFTSLSNIIYTSDFNAILTENQVKFICANFNLSFNNDFVSSTSLNSVLNTNDYYYIDYSFLRSNVGLMHYDTSINVDGVFFDGSTFNRIYFLKNNVYVVVNGVHQSLLNSDNYSIFNLTRVSSASYSNGLISLINRSFNIVSSFGNYFNGWFTFDLEPFNNGAVYNNLTLDIGFTSNNISYNNIQILYDNIMGSVVGSIYYRILDNNGNSIRTDLVYEYSLVPYISKWYNVNYRQVYFDKQFINDTDFAFVDSLGTFAFISNNLNSDYTLTDMFWSIADVPYVTLRNLLGVEVFGTDLFIAFTSIISCVLAIFILRKII